MNNDKYILNGHFPIPEPDLLKWAKWFETANRIVRKDIAEITFSGMPIGTVEILTVFLGSDRSFNEGNPILFETTICGGPLDSLFQRCSTWETAELIHEKFCELVKRSLPAC